MSVLVIMLNFQNRRVGYCSSFKQHHVVLVASDYRFDRVSTQRPQFVVHYRKMSAHINIMCITS